MLPASFSSRQILPHRLRVWVVATRLLLGLLVTFWLLLALAWALLHGWIVPRIDQFRPQLQALASEATGLRVEIGELRARSIGIIPSFELRQVRLLDAQGRTALQLPQVLAALSPRSVLTADLEQLVIQGAELDVRRTAQGQLLLAGIPVSPPEPGGEHALADWLFSQQEWALLDGTVHWTDEQQGVALTLTQVDAVMRNPGQRHQLRLDATPPPEWGERFSLRGLFKQPLLSTHSGHWRQWTGQLYGQFSRIDIAPLQAYARLAGLRLDRGRGALRAWLDVDHGRLAGATADVALEDAQAQLAPQLQPLAFTQVAGRLSWRDQGDAGLDLNTEALRFDTADGLAWPGGNLALHLALDEKGRTRRGQVKADRLDLQALAAIAQRLPLPEAWRTEMQALAPQGLVDQLEASWQGSLDQPGQLSAKGRLSELSLAADPSQHRPGLSGLGLDFKLQREAGEDRAQATFQLQRGWLEFPGIFEEPRLPLDKFSGELRLRRDARGTELELRQGALLAADAQGQFHGTWKQPAGGDPRGSLDLQGQLSRADGTRVWRYLPQALPASVRQYVRQAVTQGQLSDVRFKVKGPLASFPFQGSRDGEFLVSGRLRGASYAYAPEALMPAGSKPWPALAQLDAELVFDKASLLVRKAQAKVAGQPGLALGRMEARIADLGQQPVVEVHGDFKGPAAQLLAVVNRSPLGDFTGQALALATASGPADGELRLSLPLNDLARSKVQGSLNLAGNDVQLRPDVPTLARTRARLTFSETGFELKGAQARVLGGELRFDGGMRPGRRGEEPEISFRGQGTASAEGLQQWRELAPLAPLLRQASGSTGYILNLGVRQGALELGIASTLAGLGLALPEPLNKPAAATLPLRLEKTVQRDSLGAGKRLRDRLSLQLGPGAGLARPVSASYLRDISGAQPQVLAGQISVGLEREAELAGREVRAQVQLPRLDLDAWAPLLAPAGAGAGEAGAATGYLPSTYSLRVGTLRLQGHQLQDVLLGGKREDGVWRGNVNAGELSGFAEYRPASGGAPGRLFARLSRLSLGAGTANEVEALLESQPSSIPALDIVIEDLELRGKKLGRLEMEAVNRHLAGREATREWRLNKLNLSVPEATLTASGSWAAQPGATRRATSLSFRLDVSDSGELLKRLGQAGVLRRGKGRLEGQVSWMGSPLSLHHPSLGGQLVVDVEAGQFLKADPGAAKLLGVLNLQALPRRLVLDFRDVFSEGFAFDSIRGEVAIAQGVATTRNLRIKGVNAAVLMEGSADIAHETQDLRVLVVPEINAGAASLLAYAANPALALSTLLAQWVLRQPLSDANTQEFLIKGAWQDPQIQRVTRQKAPAEPARAAEARP